MTVLMSGDQHVRHGDGHESGARMEYPLQHLGLVHHGVVYVVLGGLRSAIFNEVLQFLLIWLGALLIPILGLIEAGGWNGMEARILAEFAALARRLHAPVVNPGIVSIENPMGINWTGIVFGLGAIISSATGRRTSWSCSA